MISKPDIGLSFIKDYKNRIITDASPTSPLLVRLREKGQARFRELGFPSVKDEEWKYTSLSVITERKFHIPAQHDLEEFDQFRNYCSPSDINIVFVNGIFSPQLSNLKNLPKGVKILNLAEAVLANDPEITALLEKHNLEDSDAFVALSHALITDGAYIRIDNKVVVSSLIHIVHVTSLKDRDAIISPRSHIFMGTSSEADILESHIGFSEHSYFTNALTDIFLSEAANLRYSKAQGEGSKSFHIGTTRAFLKRDSHLDTFSLTIGAALSRHNLNIVMEETGANAILNGLYIVKDEQHVDNHTSVDHRPPNCTSNQLYKGILHDNSRAIFNGKIFVRREAQQTNSYQLNKNILLGQGCRVDTKPQLEIFADDVKCTHGATIGQLNEDEIFYLRSRAIPKDTAVKLLARGFVDDILNRIKNKSVWTKLNKLLSDNFELLH